VSSNIRIQRICQHCGKEFTAQTTVTRYCGNGCSKRAYKLRVKAGKIEASNKETKRLKERPIEKIKAKEFLTVRDTAQLLNCSVGTAYRLIKKGIIIGVNISERKTLVRRSEIDSFFDQYEPLKPKTERKPEPVQLTPADCYNLTEVQNKYGISEKALHDIIIRRGLPKIREGRFAYVPKAAIDQILS
jgi:excisionase family DNA binding protein